MKRLNKNEIFLTIIAVMTIAIAVAGVFRLSELHKYGVIDSSSDEDWQREESEVTIYSVSDLNDELIGEKINVVGFMCNPRTDVEGTWICDKPFTSIYDVENEVKVFNDTAIKYTTYSVIIFGKLEKDDSGYVLNNASIYVYGGNDAKYKNINEMIDSDVIDSLMDAFRAGYVDDNTKERLESAVKICDSLGENEIGQVIRTLIENADADFEEEYNIFRAAVVER